LQWWDRLITSKGDEGNRVNSPPSEYSQGAHLKNSIQPVLVVNDIPEPPFPFPPPDAIRVIPENADGGTPLQVVPINPSDPATPLKVQGSLAAVQTSRLFIEVTMRESLAPNATATYTPFLSVNPILSTFLDGVDTYGILRHVWAVDTDIDGRGAGGWLVKPRLYRGVGRTITNYGVGIDHFVVEPHAATADPATVDGYSLYPNTPMQLKALPSQSGNAFGLAMDVTNQFQAAATLDMGCEIIAYPPGLSPYTQLRHVVLPQ